MCDLAGGDVLGAPKERCQRELQALIERQQSLLERVTASDRERVEPILRAQKVELQRSQEQELNLERRAREDAARDQRRPEDAQMRDPRGGRERASDPGGDRAAPRQGAAGA